MLHIFFFNLNILYSLKYDGTKNLQKYLQEMNTQN